MFATRLGPSIRSNTSWIAGRITGIFRQLRSVVES
jgi:hypothetical protein